MNSEYKQQDMDYNTTEDTARIYESIANRMNGFLYRSRHDKSFTMLNLAGVVKKVTGYSEKDLLDNNRLSYMSLIHQDDTERLDRVIRSEEHTSELQSRPHLVCRLLLEKKKNKKIYQSY